MIKLGKLVSKPKKEAKTAKKVVESKPSKPKNKPIMEAKNFSIQDYMANNKIEMGSIKKEVGDTTYKGGHNDLRKTSYKVNIKDGKFQLDTHKTILTEAVSYPSQQEADALLDWTNALSSVSTGGSPIVRAAFNKAEDIRREAWEEIFGDKSPWEVQRKGNKSVSKWSDFKAKKLGL